MIQSLKRTDLKIWFWPLGIALVLHIAAAWWSDGFHNPDEHWQIFEFASYKLGWTRAQDLPWEFGAQIRPWLQPGALVLLTQALQAVGVHSVLWITFCFKLLISLLGLGSIVSWTRALRPFFSDRSVYVHLIWAQSLFWFHPWFHARASGESLAAAFQFFALGALLRNRPLVAGLFLGLAFQARALMAIQLLAIAGWLWMERKPWRWWWQGATGVLLTLGIGAGIDRWGYGNWVFPPWRYVWVNGVQGKAQHYGVSPWWSYLTMSLEKMPPFLGPLALALCVFFVVVSALSSSARGAKMLPRGWAHLLNPWRWVLWMTLPYLFLHHLVAHKELRFLYVIASFLPLIFVIVFQLIRQRWRQWHHWHHRRLGVFLLRIVLGLILCIDLPYLVLGAVSAERNRSRFQLQISDRFPQGVVLHSAAEVDPMRESILHFSWGVPPGYSFVGGLHGRALADEARKKTSLRPFWVYTEKWTPDADQWDFFSQHCRMEYSVIPSWLAHLDFRGWVGRAQAWSLWRCD